MAIAAAVRSLLDDTVDDAERQRFGSGHDAAAGDQLDRRRRPGEARQALRPAGARHDAEFDLGQAEPGFGRGDAVMAAERDLQAAAQCRAVDRGDDGFVACLDPFDDLRQRRFGHRRPELADVGATDEIAAGACDDDCGDRVGLGGMPDRRVRGRRAWRPRPR